MMQTTHVGDHPKPASILFLPIIDMEPGNITCVNSTLHFIADHGRCYNVTPVVTFDQPLWRKALTILKSEPENSCLKRVVLRLGGFHTLMSFLGAIGHIMAGSGLQFLLQQVYANNTVDHMLSGKAYARAVRGHLLVVAALNSVLMEKTYGHQVPSNKENVHEPSDIISTDGTSASDLEEATEPLHEVISGDMTLDDIEASEAIGQISDRLKATKTSLKEIATSRLWLQYIEMVNILRQFLRAERTGDWDLHLQFLQEMLPYLAAAGHNLYTKSIHIYLQEMTLLSSNHPDVHRQFKKGLHVVSERQIFFGAGCNFQQSNFKCDCCCRSRGEGACPAVQRESWRIIRHPSCSTLPPKGLCRKFLCAPTQFTTNISCCPVSQHACLPSSPTVVRC